MTGRGVNECVDEFGRGFEDFPVYFSVKFCLEKAEFLKKLKR